MFEGKPIIGAARQVVAIWLATVIIAIGPLCAAHAAQHTGAKATAGEGAATPPEIHELLTLLADPKNRELLTLLANPKIQEWLEEQGETKATAGSAQETDNSVEDYLNSRAGAIREQMVALARAIPDLPNQFERAAARYSAVHGEHGWAWTLFYLAIFGALGFGAEWLFRSVTRRIHARLASHPLEMTVRDRLHVVAARFAFAVGRAAAFALGSVGLFLALDWNPILRGTVLGYLIAFVAIRVAAAIGDSLLAPDREHFRSIPTNTVAARFWCRRLIAFVGWFTLGWLIVQECSALGFSTEGLQLVAYTLGLGSVAIALESVWRVPIPPRGVAEAPSAETHRFGRGARNTALSLGIILLWALWMTEPGINRVGLGFWLILLIIALPLAIAVSRRAVEHLLRPPGSTETAEGPPNVITVCLERGIRALLIIGAVAVLAWAWGVDVVHLAEQDTWFARVVHGVLSAVVILLVADLLWQVMKTAIDRKLAESADLGQPNTDEARKRARLRTLLPIFRNILFVVVIAVAALMALAEMGVQIGPLVAGLGVFGIAVGFGAQTFVRDVMAGMFYLLDDAFRVGEYIQAGNYKGTVEGFSIRSVRLRHQRGAVYTVPFSLLGAVQNQSRDWVIDKLMVGITYDSDIDRARKLIKQIGLDLAKDPEFAPLILEPLKMQGVDALGDFAVQLRMKMMTLPGENFVIRRQALAMIKKAFDANGIKFAFPTVQIASDSEPSTAATAGAAKRALELTQPAAA
jgi:small-conductance mechanosensitive channel